MSYLFKAISYILSRYLLGKKYLVGSAPSYGLKLKFKTQDGGGRAIYKKGIYEKDISDLLISNLSLNDGDVVLDVGANIGWYSLLISKYKNKGIIIHSFEPDPDNYQCLRHNIVLNGIDNVNTHMMGVSNKTGTKTLYLYKKSNTGRHSMLEINDGDSIEVKTTSFDDFLQEKNLEPERVKFLKIDIEGFEYFAFQGGGELLRSVPYIIAEFSPGYMRKGGVEPIKLLELLKANNYTPYTLEQGINSIDQSTLLARDNNINLLWIKEGQPLWK